MKYNNSQGNFFLSALTVLFIGLKLTRYIDWSWWWVLSPIWIPSVLVISIFSFYFGSKYLILKLKNK